MCGGSLLKAIHLITQLYMSQAVRERAAEAGQFAAIRQLLSSYWAALLAAHQPLALLPAAGGGVGPPGIVRGGPSLGQLRPAVQAEALPKVFATPGKIAPTQVTVVPKQPLQNNPRLPPCTDPDECIAIIDTSTYQS